MVKVIASSLRKGNVVDKDGKLYVILFAENIHPGKGTPVTQLDMPLPRRKSVTLNSAGFVLGDTVPPASTGPVSVKASEVASSVVRSHSALDVINGSGFLFKTIGKVLATSKVICCCRQRRRQRGRRSTQPYQAASMKRMMVSP